MPSSSEPVQGLIGVDHTRWATHGKPSEAHAHPHATEKLAFVDNGIIDNFLRTASGTRRRRLCLKTGTDPEIVAHLVNPRTGLRQTPVEAIAASLPRQRGAFALTFLCESEEDLLISGRKGWLLAVGVGDGEMYLGSDALARFINLIAYLEEGGAHPEIEAEASDGFADGEVSVVRNNARQLRFKSESTGFQD